MASEAQKRATAKYNKEKSMYFTVKLNRAEDQDIIEFLKTLSNRQGYIKGLIRQDMKKEPH